jgi:hypothetical protein
MTLQTREEEEILHKIRRLDERVEAVEFLCREILEELRPTFAPTSDIVVTPVDSVPPTGL